MKHCDKKNCIFYGLTIFANYAVIVVLLFMASQVYGAEKWIALLFIIPPLLSVTALRKMGDRETRGLKKRIRKASLRKELAELKDFDED